MGRRGDLTSYQICYFFVKTLLRFLTSVPRERSSLTKGITPRMMSTPLLSTKNKAHLWGGPCKRKTRMDCIQAPIITSTKHRNTMTSIWNGTNKKKKNLRFLFVFDKNIFVSHSKTFDKTPTTRDWPLISRATGHKNRPAMVALRRKRENQFEILLLCKKV